MPMAPEAPVSPMAQAPPDRPSMQLEDLLNNALAIIMQDGGIDDNEMAALRGFQEQIFLMIQKQGGIQPSGAQQAGGAQAGPPPNPWDMNQNTEDYGSIPGSSPTENGAY